jgi:hypothetical protein
LSTAHQRQQAKSFWNVERIAHRGPPGHFAAVYELSFTGPNVSSSPAAILPGVLADVLRVSANSKGMLRLEKPRLGNLRLRIVRI